MKLCAFDMEPKMEVPVFFVGERVRRRGNTPQWRRGGRSIRANTMNVRVYSGHLTNGVNQIDLTGRLSGGIYRLSCTDGTVKAFTILP